MKILLKNREMLQSAGRWDIDFHLPAEGIQQFPETLLKRVDEVADIVKDKRDPTKEPDVVFQYIDISSVDVTIGSIANYQDVDGVEAPSRARKVVRAFDLIVSTCRPKRGAIAIVPIKLHNQIASTAFSIVRAHDDVNPFYLHYALRLQSTLEQFRKWSTGSSYPAILDSDVKKTIIPVPSSEIQDAIATKVMTALQERSRIMLIANTAWAKTLNGITTSLCGKDTDILMPVLETSDLRIFSLAEVRDKLKELPPIATDGDVQNDEVYFPHLL